LEDPKTLISEASAVLRDCERFLEVATELVVGIPARREEALKDLAAARERKEEVDEKWRRVFYYDTASREEEEEEAYREYWRASDDVTRAQAALGSDDLVPENRKAVARQVAGLVRQESRRRLDDIDARSAGDPEVRRIVSEYKEEVDRNTYRLITRFQAARPLERAELRKCKSEAQAIVARGAGSSPA
jgi:hypothetical protein